MNKYQKQRNAWLTQYQQTRQELQTLVRLSQDLTSSDEATEIGEIKMTKKQTSDQVYYKYFDCIQVDLMSLGKIDREIKAIMESGADLDMEIPKLVEKYREN